MYIKRRIISLLVLCVFILLCFAESENTPPIEVKTTIDRQEITVGDNIIYRIECEDLQKGDIEFPLNLKSLGNFEIKDVEVDEKQAIYTLTNFNVGEDTIPPLTLKYKIDGEEYEIETGKISVTIESVLTPDIKDIRDIKPPLDIPLNKLPFILGFISAVLIGGGVYFLLKKIKKGRIHIIEKEIRPAHEIAYERLKLLKLDERRVKEYYIELSDTIRRYIEARFGISAPTETTYELLAALKKKKIKYLNFNHMRDFFWGCDLVKFAKYVPDIDAVKRDSNSARLIIDETKEREEEMFNVKC